VATSVYDGDQPSTANVAIDSSETEMGALEVKTGLAGTGETPAYLSTASGSFVWRGQTLSFRSGIPYQLDPALLAALQAQSVTVVAT
jgi:hypothetical protein